jgi:hypothetical protein
MEELQAGDPARIGPYAISARLGAGGMGQVFLGRSQGGRLVAVKDSMCGPASAYGIPATALPPGTPDAGFAVS